jgi:hypothetical protein
MTEELRTKIKNNKDKLNDYQTAGEESARFTVCLYVYVVQ